MKIEIYESYENSGYGIFSPKVGEVQLGERKIPIITQLMEFSLYFTPNIGVCWASRLAERPVDLQPVILVGPKSLQWYRDRGILEPVIGHEIGHLMNGDLGTLDEAISNWGSKDPPRDIKKEIAADNYSAAIFGAGEVIHALEVCLETDPQNEEISIRISELRKLAA